MILDLFHEHGPFAGPITPISESRVVGRPERYQEEGIYSRTIAHIIALRKASIESCKRAIASPPWKPYEMLIVEGRVAM